MKVGVVTWDGGSNRQPFETLCRGLRKRGDEVHVMSHDAHRACFVDLGASFEVLPVGEKPPGARPSVAEERDRILSVWLSQEVADAVTAMLTATSFDVAVVDVSLLSALAACEATGTPAVALHHTLPGAVWSGPRRPQFETFVEPANAVRRKLGLPSATGFADLLSAAAAHIVPTAAALDAPVPWNLPVHYVGPLQPVAAAADLPALPPRFVLVSFSTTWQRQVEVLQQAIDALADLDGEVVVTTGRSVDPAELIAAANTIVAGEIAHESILDRVDAVITHAGHGTVLSALAAGVPLVCVPMGRDQHDVTRAVLAAGAGVEVRADTIRTDLVGAVRQVLADQRFRSEAARIARSMSSHGGVEDALAIIDRCRRPT